MRASRWRRFGLDLLAVVVFVVIGRAAHAHQLTPAGIASTTWPFGIGIASGWSALLLRRRDGLSLSAGIWVAICTVTIGMVLRVLAGQGTAVAFVFVAIGFLTAATGAWRLVYRLWTRGGSTPRSRTGPTTVLWKGPEHCASRPCQLK